MTLKIRLCAFEGCTTFCAFTYCAKHRRLLKAQPKVSTAEQAHRAREAREAREQHDPLFQATEETSA